MTRKIESPFIPGPAGRLEALLEEPDDGDPIRAALVCHPHPQFGGTMHNKVVYRIARGLRRAGAVVLRFNYRGVNLSEGAYDNGAGETDDARAALGWLRERYPELPYLLAGFSFGSRIVQRIGCEAGPELILAAGFPTRHTDTNEYLDCVTPRIFIQSTNDQYGPRQEFQAFHDRLRGDSRLIWIEAKDHFFVDALEDLENTVAALPISSAEFSKKPNTYL
jgi:alpha/beta superfamily hydrolase